MTASFPATRWSIIAAAGAGGGDVASARAALEELCRLYWYPLYAFARRSGLAPEDAEDATQSFLAAVLEEKLFAAADPSVGRLRSFLLKAFSRDLADARRDASRQKRGGHLEIVPLDLTGAEDRFLTEPAGAEPVHQFEAAWATAMLEGAVRKLQADYHESGRGPLFDTLRPCLGMGDAALPDHAALAAELSLSPVALRQAVSRLRDRFRTALRSQIADTLREPTEEAIDDELRNLRAILSSSATPWQAA